MQHGHRLVLFARRSGDWRTHRPPNRRCPGPGRVRTTGMLGHPDEENAHEHHQEDCDRGGAGDWVALAGGDPAVLACWSWQGREVEEQRGQNAEDYNEWDWVAEDVAKAVYE